MKTLEFLAALTGAVSVWLSVRQNIWSWPLAIVNVSLTGIVLYGAKLYANAGLQIVYAVLSIYGWYQWLYGGANRTELKVSRTPPRLAAALLVIAVAGAVAIGALLRTGTDASLPWLDAALSSTSLIAQWMMTRKLFENWAIWFAVDLIYVPMFLYTGQYWLAALYAVFLVLATRGWIEWRRSMAATPLPARA